MYIQGDIVPDIGRVENNHCGLPWPVGINWLLFGVVQVRGYSDGYSYWCDAITGKELSDDEVKSRRNNTAYDYESKFSKCNEWREENKERYMKGKQIDECIRFGISPLRWKMKCFWNRLFNRS